MKGFTGDFELPPRSEVLVRLFDQLWPVVNARVDVARVDEIKILWPVGPIFFHVVGFEADVGIDPTLIYQYTRS